jgi:uncharacterized protein YkwD
MKKIFTLALAAAMLFTFALPTAASAVVTRDVLRATENVVPSVPTSANANAQIRDVFRLTNNERRRHFRPAVRESAALNAAAATRAREAAQNWSHTRPNGQSWSTVLAQHNVTGWAHASENLSRVTGGANPAAAYRAVQSWMNSPSHREALLRADLTHVGHGVHFDAATNTYFWAQIFIHDGSRNSLTLWDIIMGVVLNVLRIFGL